MNRFLKIAYLVIFFTALSLPALHFFGAKESGHAAEAVARWIADRLDGRC